MARQRFIHPEFWSDPAVGQLTPTERLFFVGCFSNADDEGRLLGNPAYLRSIIFPYDDMTLAEVKEVRDHVISIIPNLILYEVDGIEYLTFLKWFEYQKPKYPQPSKLPPPPGTNLRPPEKWYVPKDIRKRVLEKFGNRCAVCGSTDNLQIDHIIPLKHGGTSNEDNLQVLCASCNNRKHDKLVPITERRSLKSEDDSSKLVETCANLEKDLLLGLGRDGLGIDRDGLGREETATSCDAPIEEQRDATQTEREILGVFKAIPGYRIDFSKDLSHVRSLAIDYPQLDLLNEARKWRTYKLDKPLKAKANPRLQFRNWCEIATKQKAERSRAAPSDRASPELEPWRRKQFEKMLAETEMPDKGG